MDIMHKKTGKTFKIALLILLSLMLCQNISSQSITWQRTYRSPLINGDDDGFDGCFSDGSNFYVVGSVASGPPYFFVLKIDLFGDTIWTKTFSDGRLLAVTPDRNFGCVATGLRGAPFSLNINNSGTIIWDKTYNNAEAHDILRTDDSGYVLCAGIFSGYVCKLDTVGNLQWERTYTSVPLELYTIEIALDGGYILGGRKFISGNWKAYLLKIDGAGNIVWENTFMYEASITAIAKKNNGYVFISSTFVGSPLRTVILKTDLTGNLLLADTLLNNSLWDSYPSILGINQNKFIVSFHSNVPEPEIWGSRIVSIDSNLRVIKELLLKPDTNSLNIYKVIKAPGSNVDDLLCIGSAEPNSGGDLDIYIARIDSSLNQPPPNSISSISNEIPKNHILFQNYPNPFNNATIIQYAVSTLSKVVIKIFDILGKEIATLNNKTLLPGTYMLSYNFNNETSGLYLYQLIVDNKVVATKKMIFLK